MQKSTLAKIVWIFLTMGACATALAQTYSNAVMGLNPAAYWPLTETDQPPQVLNLTATNIGTAGAAGDGYYGGWYQPSGNQWYITNNIAMESGPISGDQAMNCQVSQGQYIILPRRTNGVANAAVTVTVPFSVEAWVNPSSINYGLLSVVSEGGETTMNVGGPNPTNQFYGGPSTGWDGFSLGIYQTYFFFNCYLTNGVGYKSHELDSPHLLQVGQWVHVVTTYNGSQVFMYTNGVQCGEETIPANGAGLTYVVDQTSPLIIGGGPAEPVSYGNSFRGGLAEVAIYNQALSSAQVLNHYQSATSVASYTNTVLGDSPTIFLRMNDGQGQTGAGYPSALFPVATNYGTLGAAANGVYQQGTTPGIAGPPYSGFGAHSKAVAINGWFGGVDVGSSNIPAALSPAGKVPLSVVAWYQTGPADSPGRFQTILGQSTNSYTLALGQNTATGENHFNPGNQSAELQFSSVAQVTNNGFAFNDGNWHMAAGVSDGTNEYLYLDGALALSNNIPNGISINGSTSDLLLGGDPQLCYPTYGTPYNTIRSLDGNIAQVAYFTNALTVTQIQSLFNAAGVPPYVWQEPVSSVTANGGQDVTVSAGIRGSDLTYQWYLNGTAVAGQTGASLVLNPASATNSGAYYLIAGDASGSVTSSVVNVTIYGAPVIMQQSPSQLEIFSNCSPVLYVTASGETPHYQWNLSGAAIPGATNSTYDVTNIMLSGTYGCTLTNNAGTNYITPIAITVLADPTAPYPAQVLANGPIAYYRLDEAPNATTAYDYVSGFNAGYTNALTGYPGYTSSSGSPGGSDPNETCALFGYDSPPNNYAGDVTPFPNFSTPNGSNAEFTVESWINETYFNSTLDGDCIVGLGYGGAEQFVLDTGASTSGYLRFFVRNAAGTVSAASSTRSVSTDGVWHHVVGVCDEAGGHIYLYLDGNLLASAAITSGSGILSSTMPLSIGSRESGNYNPPNYDYQYYGYIDDVSVYKKALSAAQVQADYYAAGIAPINVQVEPANLTTNEGATVTFTTTVQGGTAPFTYQWTGPNGTISGQTSSNLVLTDVQPDQSGNYSVTVANDYGSTNVQVNLEVNQGTAQLVQNIEPTNVVTYQGDPVTLTIGLSGSLPFYYQWYQDGAAVAGATNSSYDFDALLGTNTYYCVASNNYSYSEGSGPVVSGTATVAGEPITTVNPSSFNSHLKITFSGYTNSETLQDFPALVNLGTNLTGFSYSEFAGANGADLRFADSSGTRELPYEVEQWDGTNGVSSVWVQVPALSGSTNTSIFAYWGNPTNTTPPAYTTNGAVWEPASFLGLPGYEVVYHLQQTNFPYLDSTTNYPALDGVAPSVAPGIVGNGALFNGSSDYLDAGDVNLGNEFTESAWVNLAADAFNIQGVWANGGGGYSSAEIALFINFYNTADGGLLLGTGDGSSGQQPESTTGLVTPSQWHLVTAVVNRPAGTVQLYVDGKFGGSGATMTDFPTNADMNLGRFVGGSFPFNGTMDEARIHGGIDDSNWVWADYMTVANNSTFSTYSTVTNSIVLPIKLTIRVSGDDAILTWPAGTLQSASELNGPYSNVTGVTSPYTNAISGAQHYYRVQAQY